MIHFPYDDKEYSSIITKLCIIIAIVGIIFIMASFFFA